MAYDKAAVQMKGLGAITNFDLSLYLDLLDPGVLKTRRQTTRFPTIFTSVLPEASCWRRCYYLAYPLVIVLHVPIWIGRDSSLGHYGCVCLLQRTCKPTSTPASVPPKPPPRRRPPSLPQLRDLALPQLPHLRAPRRPTCAQAPTASSSSHTR